ncbi:MAG: mannose-6-phosphate isomerase, class I [Lachnospiraceae bacterium]|nr:mannose-6-phosphate isomerase, class I [Lachnospiraceae bacterium]
MDLLFLKPVFKQMIWGGNRMRTEYGYDIPGNDTGECWAISAHPNGDGEIANGEYSGMKLSELFDKHRELFGNIPGEKFPLLTKIIDAKGDLSIQVHPDDTYAAEHENGSLGKMECWYILDCDKDATIIIGHNAKDRQELEDMISNKRWSEFIREIPIKKGDFFQINPGCVHAIKGGTMILETQQNSDITYRVYDYDRLQNGKPRELHVKQSIDVIKVPFEPAALGTGEQQSVNAWFEQLITCEYYTVWKADLKGEETLVRDQKFLLASVIEGSASIDGTPVEKGDHFIIPAGMKDMKVEGEASFIFSAVAK